jgi:putative thioredoxin
MSDTAIGDDLVKETTTASFRKDVIAESAKTPVLVDFWAPWCGPCRQLTPILEKVVRGAEGKAKLVKMNIDEHPQIAGQLGIQSIPAVIAFQNGQPVDGFMGALPESQVRTFIERLVGQASDPTAQLLEEAEAARASGDDEAAVAIYLDLLAQAPAEPKAAAGLAGIYIARGHLESARETLALVDQATANDPAVSAVRTALELAEQAADVGDLGDLRRRVDTDPADHQARFDLALALNAKGEKAAAADLLLDSFKRDRTWNEDAARKQLLQFFEAWGPTDAETVAARRRLSSLLYS